jgi:hypothetical protein
MVGILKINKLLHLSRTINDNYVIKNSVVKILLSGTYLLHANISLENYGGIGLYINTDGKLLNDIIYNKSNIFINKIFVLNKKDKISFKNLSLEDVVQKQDIEICLYKLS